MFLNDGVKCGEQLVDDIHNCQRTQTAGQQCEGNQVREKNTGQLKMFRRDGLTKFEAIGNFPTMQ
jgi:hypothetical protein